MNLPNRTGIRLTAVAMALGLVAGLGACGDDSTDVEPQAPVLTNEQGYETFEPETPPIAPETGEPTTS